MSSNDPHQPLAAASERTEVMRSAAEHAAPQAVTQDASADVAEAFQALPPAAMSYLHWSSLLFDILAHGRQYLFPIALAFLSATGQNWFWGIAAAVAMFFSLLRTFFRYFTLHFGIQNGELVVKQGLIFINTRTIPARKIQNIDLRQNLLHRLFSVFEVHVETASGQDAEAVLRVLTKQQIDRLRGEIYAAQNPNRPLSGPQTTQANEPSSSDLIATAGAVVATTSQGVENAYATAGLPAQPSDPANVAASDWRQPHGSLESTAVAGPQSAAAASPTLTNDQLLQRVPIRSLLLAGLTSNRGWVVVGVVIGLYYQFVSWDTWDNKVIGKWIRQLLPLVPHDQMGWLGVIAALFVVWVCLKLFGIVWYVTRFYDYQLRRHDNDLRVTCGLLTSYSVTVPRERIQFISLQQPWLFRWTGHYRVSIETAGGASQADGQDQIQMMRSAFVPILNQSDLAALLDELRPGLRWDDSNWDWRGTATGTRTRLLRSELLIGVVISGALTWAWWPWGVLVPVFVLPLVFWHAWKTAKSLRYARTDFGVVYRSGLLTRKTSMTFFEKVQTIQLNQSPFDRRWQMAELQFDTAGAGPADHLIHVPYLDAAWAQQELSVLRKLCSRRYRPGVAASQTTRSHEPTRTEFANTAPVQPPLSTTQVDLA